MTFPLRTVTLAAALLCASAATACAASPPIDWTPVRFEGDSASFAGAFARPTGPGPFPALVVLHGSEPGRKASALACSLATRLLPHGIAVLSFDKRGVGESSGRYREIPDLHEAAGDGLAAVRFLAARDDVARDRIGGWGPSQGGWVGPQMAATSQDVAFVVSVSGPGMSPEEQSAYQRAVELREAGLPEDAIARLTALRARLVAFWLGEPDDSLDAAWAAVRAEPWFARACDVDVLYGRIGRLERVPAARHLPPDVLEGMRWSRYDPIPTAERVRVPVLHVYGAKDRHAPVEASARALRAAYARGKNAHVTFETFADGGHAIQFVAAHAESLRATRAPAAGAPSAWRFAPGYFDLLERWIVAAARRRD
jgi:dienelactone hydrolase